MKKSRVVGFTVLELVVLAGFLVIIASSLLFVFDPFERRKAKRDTAFYQDAEVLTQALNDFYTSRGAMPWALAVDESQQSSTSLGWRPARAVGVGLCADSQCSRPGVLVETGKLPSNFTGRDLYVGKGPGRQAPVWACFIPASKAARRAAGQLYRIDLNESIPLSGTLENCSATVTWQEEDVCYLCVAK